MTNDQMLVFIRAAKIALNYLEENLGSPDSAYEMEFNAAKVAKVAKKEAATVAKEEAAKALVEAKAKAEAKEEAAKALVEAEAKAEAKAKTMAAKAEAAKAEAAKAEAAKAEAAKAEAAKAEAAKAEAADIANIAPGPGISLNQLKEELRGMAAKVGDVNWVVRLLKTYSSQGTFDSLPIDTYEDVLASAKQTVTGMLAAQAEV